MSVFVFYFGFLNLKMENIVPRGESIAQKNFLVSLNLWIAIIVKYNFVYIYLYQFKFFYYDIEWSSLATEWAVAEKKENQINKQIINNNNRDTEEKKKRKLSAQYATKNFVIAMRTATKKYFQWCNFNTWLNVTVIIDHTIFYVHIMYFERDTCCLDRLG